MGVSVDDKVLEAKLPCSFLVVAINKGFKVEGFGSRPRSTMILIMGTHPSKKKMS